MKGCASYDFPVYTKAFHGCLCSIKFITDENDVMHNHCQTFAYGT